MRNPLITLTTDFGGADHFTGAMKGVILSIEPRAKIVDITHELRPFEIVEAAFTFGQAWRWFPEKTIHVVVVDPGVGTARRPVLAEAAGHYFIGPDNGLLPMALAGTKYDMRQITAEEYFLKPVSATFHGRDIFAPVAAHLAAGVPVERFGEKIADEWRTGSFEPVRTGKRVWTGTILKIDRFGNLITNLHIRDFEAVRTRPFELLAGMERLSRLAGTFAEGAVGEPVVIVGSAGYLEVAVNQDSAARRLGVAAGAPVELKLF